MNEEELKDAKKKWKNHGRCARQRGIDFQLTFDEWLTIWLDSGHWHERGCRKGQYVMSRYGDIGPYTTSNVFIQTTEMNLSEGKIGKKRSEETKRKMSEGLKGRKLSEETKQRMRDKKKPGVSAANKGRKWSEEHKRSLSNAFKAAWAKKKALC